MDESDKGSPHDNRPKDEDLKYAWTLFGELRKEILETQKSRVQLIGFKITVLGATTAIMVAQADGLPYGLLVIPALAAVFFDVLVAAHSFTIKRIAFFTRTVLEPLLREASKWPTNEPTWEQFMYYQPVRRPFDLAGNAGHDDCHRCCRSRLVIQPLPSGDMAPAWAAPPCLGVRHRGTNHSIGRFEMGIWTPKGPVNRTRGIEEGRASHSTRRLNCASVELASTRSSHIACARASA